MPENDPGQFEGCVNVVRDQRGKAAGPGVDAGAAKTVFRDRDAGCEAQLTRMLSCWSVLCVVLPFPP